MALFIHFASMEECLDRLRAVCGGEAGILEGRAEAQRESAYACVCVCVIITVSLDSHVCYVSYVPGALLCTL